MICPECKEDMEFEEAKSFSGYWYCDCGFEATGVNIPTADGDGLIDYVEMLDKEEK